MQVRKASRVTLEGTLAEVPSCQRVGTSIPRGASKVSKDMQGTIRELPRTQLSKPAEELLPALVFTKQGFKDKQCAQEGSRNKELSTIVIFIP